MTDSRGGHSSELEQTPLDSNQHGQAQNIIDETSATYGNTTQSDLGANIESHDEALKDRVDGAVRSGPKKADESSGGRVQVGETGDLHDLAAKRQP
ncbi:hypothetical protein K445DRAFT_312658 [Daldinia sp. EC12]|uniref:Uncharacterized protein n=1 Tax=Daldinia eschscholtzii TaxID=292717 RepID=A0AAX6MD61_9PEZI|nr:hypothetical protein F4774DRAFT_405439 [Daldinia eschscholtzii]OTB20227.1 hypothetical protein K445DRAFT_312658 [Daldinia sp. EC12]